MSKNSEEAAAEEKTERDENIVFVGSKPLMSYIVAAVTQLNRNPDEVILKARGRAISRAVDVAEVLRTRPRGKEHSHQYGAGEDC